MPSPILLSTWPFGLPANDAGFPHLSNSILDALEQTCIFCENDPTCDSVGIGGLPDAAGNVTLDGAIMLSPARCAGVACIRRHAHPVSISRKVMELTPHKMLVGEFADEFARKHGFAHANLLTEDARLKWESWKRSGRYHDFHSGKLIVAEESHDTLGVIGIDAHGVIGAACTTSGRAFKLPGRVGDSPIIGHGLYCDPRAGAAVATGTGELMIGTCASFLAIEKMKEGHAPRDAVKSVLERVAESYSLHESDQCALIVLTPEGESASGCLRPGFVVARTTGEGGRMIDPDLVLLT